MAKAKFTKRMKCLAVNQTIGRSVVSFASDIQTDKPGPEGRPGATAKNVVTFNFSNPTEAAGFTPDKEYTISITE